MDIGSLLQGPMGEAIIGQLAESAGIDKKTASMAASVALPALVNGMARNAKDPKGAESLAGALERDHDGSILDNLGSALGQQQTRQNGEKILGHILGNKKGAVESMIGQSTGMQSDQTTALLSQLAPVLMGALGKQKREQGLDVGGLAEMLGGTRKQMERELPSEQGSLLNSILDADGDGDITDDVTRIGMKVLGNFFKK